MTQKERHAELKRSKERVTFLYKRIKHVKDQLTDVSYLFDSLRGYRHEVSILEERIKNLRENIKKEDRRIKG